jgi:hypothetical protein
VTSDGLRIRYRRSGGIAGLDMTADALAHELSNEQAELATQLLDNPPGPPAGPSAGSAAADQFSYQLELDDGIRRHTFHWSEQEVPDLARPLLTAMHSRAAPSRPTGRRIQG